ncbi:ribonuclease inhibitor domain-containing protein [Trichomonas vaginalis G3]|uniref:ribonuclease inhibitor domain-containing protein n=1 Tax=Trichomonas vaginalis (strain ATCC PRA-98 / G3) TaxID=412133 RepID=UPI0021E5A254|nr:ribonuclease inhibitor domain-containing protein [Trichomonas vaginalis G3]KAI5498783.1 ribonuclease inhibitor domain-containing protein [Trichomonas vaginalis G3]
MFSNCYSLTEVNFTGYELYPKAFQFCINLKKFTFQYEEIHIEEIPDYCFYGCVNLEEINIPDRITEIYDFAFYNTSLRNGINLNKVQSLGQYSFAFSKLTSITIKNAINFNSENDYYVLDYDNLHIFDHCDNLEKVIFEKSGFISLYEFINCKEFKTLETNGAFKLMDGMLCVTRGYEDSRRYEDYRRNEDSTNNITAIYLYNISAKYERVTIPENIFGILFFAFRYANNIKTIAISHTMQILPYAFADMASLEEVYFNSNEIPYVCFYNCTKLSKVTLSDNVKRINKYSFANTNLTEIVLPLSLENIVIPFINTSIAKIGFKDGQNHPDFIATKNEFIRINHDKNDEMEIMFLFGNISNKITKLTEGIKSINLESLKTNSDDNVILMLPHSIQKIEIYETDYEDLHYYREEIDGIRVTIHEDYQYNYEISYPKLCYDWINPIQVLGDEPYDHDHIELREIMERTSSGPKVEFYSLTYPEYYIGFIEVINKSCESNLNYEEENATKPQCNNQ